MSLYSIYRQTLSGCPVPASHGLAMAEALRGLPLETQQKRILEFGRWAVKRFTDYDMDAAYASILPDYVPEDDPFVVALRERRIPFHSRMAFLDYVSTLEYSSSCGLRQRLARELEATYPLQKWARRLHRQQEGQTEAEKQRLELVALLRREAALEACDPRPEDEAHAADLPGENPSGRMTG
ncbi:MAG: hypothetical protein IJ041_09085 [Clostridia bacterium]|nr:hypothetical protein [Clostridia bacterium]